MLNRLLYCYTIRLKSFFRRIYYDLAKELVVSISALTIFATFLYIFNDFLNVEIQNLSTKMRERFAETINYVVLFLATWICARSLKEEMVSEENWMALFSRVGEKPVLKKSFFILQSFTLIVFIY